MQAHNRKAQKGPRKRPEEHVRKYRSGRRTLVNRGVMRLKKGKLRKVLPGPQVIGLAKLLVRRLKKFCIKIELAGSIRRQKPMPYDIDILVIPAGGLSWQGIIDSIRRMGGNILSSGQKRVESRIHGIKVDIIFTEAKSWGAALMYLTGPAGANIWNRTLARQKGMLLNQYGLFHQTAEGIGEQVPAYSEEEIYKALGKGYRTPEHRGEPR